MGHKGILSYKSFEYVGRGGTWTSTEASCDHVIVSLVVYASSFVTTPPYGVLTHHTPAFPRDRISVLEKRVRAQTKQAHR
jgi:hypothetical protein